MIFVSPRGEVAQLVEHTTENRSVASSILALATNQFLPPSAERQQCDVALPLQSARADVVLGEHRDVRPPNVLDIP
jgi:hypothetical protein